MRIIYLCFCMLMSVLIWLSCSGIACAQDSMLAQTPPAGWNSWNHFACDVSDDVVRAQADALVKTGMKSVGYTYILMEASCPKRSSEVFREFSEIYQAGYAQTGEGVIRVRSLPP